jgi:hypothetical protein
MSEQMNGEEIAHLERRKILKQVLYVLVAVGTAVAAVVLQYFWVEGSTGSVSPESFGLSVFSTIIILALIYAFVKIFSSVASPKVEVIPENDRKLLEPLIASADSKAIDQYVRLSSLSGATGVATILGLTGLPLITVALTLVFTSLYLYYDKPDLLDLAKLTLGAFIGSFVQRANTTQEIAIAAAQKAGTETPTPKNPDRPKD